MSKHNLYATISALISGALFFTGNLMMFLAFDRSTKTGFNQGKVVSISHCVVVFGMICTFVFKENFNRMHFFGVILMLMGCIIYALIDG